MEKGVLSPFSTYMIYETIGMKHFRCTVLVALFTIGALLSGCDSLIYSDLSECPQGVYVRFYSKTACATDTTFIGSVPSLTLFAFDKEGKLVHTITKENVSLTKDYELFIPVSNGYYSFVAWTGLSDVFDKKGLTKGITTKEDLLAELKAVNAVSPDLKDTPVWQGISNPVYLPNPAEVGTFYEHTAINLLELTNRVKLIVEFDKATMKDYDTKKIFAEVSSSNGTYAINGTIPPNTPQIKYSATPSYTADRATWDYHMLDLVPGHNNKLHIYYTGNKPEGEDVFDGDLIGLILIAAKNGNANLDCENDFEIKVVIKDYCVECWTHFSCSIYVNNWKVYSYSTDLSI